MTKYHLRARFARYVLRTGPFKGLSLDEMSTQQIAWLFEARDNPATDAVDAAAIAGFLAPLPEDLSPAVEEPPMQPPAISPARPAASIPPRNAPPTDALPQFPQDADLYEPPRERWGVRRGFIRVLLRVVPRAERSPASKTDAIHMR